MGEFLGFFDKLGDQWLELRSIRYALGFLIGVGISLMAIDGLLTNISGILYLICVLFCLFVLYSLCCILSTVRKKRKALSEQCEQKRSKAVILLVICIAVTSILTAACAYMFVSGFVSKDGEYVIWVDEYQMALSPNVHNNYYLLGLPVSVHGGKLDEYSRQCVFELDFRHDGTFTISYGDRLIGVTPGENGVGYSEACTSVLWKLEEAGNGVYYIVNAEEDTYLKWYEQLHNWTTNPRITDDNRSQYLMCLEKLK